ncbi:phosphonate C-P lyase system protein PhnG [Arcobacter sp. LA11]|uniref:phosphonate C-P lyase system protein PhnG n=1 Tax=Arcobacter sp. LA11 TaxID=1898176 RepID=UPI00093428AB|nr:phosphonate C-P lyase system protein PhnG [Arcobacter sp. LA11]
MKREDVNDLAQFVKLDKLQNLYKKIKKNHDVRILTTPTEQTLLVPVKDPISGGSFYSGEVLVTSTIVEVEKTKGWSMVMDSNEKLSLYVAVLDACFEKNIFKDEIKELLKEAKKEIMKETKKQNQKINSTRVSFDLM